MIAYPRVTSVLIDESLGPVPPPGSQPQLPLVTYSFNCCNMLHLASTPPGVIHSDFHVLVSSAPILSCAGPPLRPHIL